MTKVLKTFSIIVGLIILALVIGLGILVTCVSPNKFKPIIISQVKKATGRDLIIDGDLSWSLFPYLGVKVGHAVLSNPQNFTQKTFAEFKQATISVKLLPLFHGNIETNGIAVDGLTLYLIKNTNGVANWQNFSSQQPLAAASVVAVPAQVEVKDSNNRKTSFTISIPSIDVNDAHIVWNNLQTKQTADISKLSLHVRDISLNKPFHLKTDFNFTSTNPTTAGKGALDGKITLNVNQQTYVLDDFNINVKTTYHGKDITFNLKSDIAANLNNQTVKINNIESQLANLSLNGETTITDLSTAPIIRGHLKANPFDLKAFLQALGQDSANLEVAKNVSADFNFSTNSAKPALQALTTEGTVKVDELKASNIRITQINTNAKLQNGILNLAPITASLYQGSLQGQTNIDLNGPAPKIVLNAKLNNVQAEPLLQDLGASHSKIKVMGAGNIDLQVTTTGASAPVITRNLNGTAKFSFQNGKLDGVNIGYLIDSAYALIKNRPVPPENEKTTNFGTLTGTAVIRNGVISNSDLFMNSPRFDTTGQGTIDLVNEQINYQLQAMPKLAGQDDNNPLSLNHLAIPVRISGSLQNPSIAPDMGAIAKELANAQIKQAQKKWQGKLEKQLQDKVSGQAGELLKNFLGN